MILFFRTFVCFSYQ